MANINPKPVARENLLEDPTCVTVDDDNQLYEVDLDSDDDGIEIIDDTPEEDKGKPVGATPGFDPDKLEELEGISERTQQRIDRLRHEFHNEKRRANEAEAKAQEALRFAQSMQKQNSQLRQSTNQMTDTLAQSMQDSRKKIMEAAKAKYQKAFEDGDKEALVEANAEMAQAAAELATIKANTPVPQPAQPAPVQQTQPQQTQQPVYQQPQAAQPRLSPIQQKFFDAHKHWFNQPGHEAATGYAFELDRQLRGAGVDPNSEEFYSTIIHRVGTRYPQITAGEKNDIPGTDVGSTQQAPVAPAGNQGGQQRSQRANNKIQLNARQVSVAKKLGLTPKEYARSLAKVEENR